jgi:hypothetical protein
MQARSTLTASAACALFALGGFLAVPAAHAETPDTAAMLKMIENLQRELAASQKQQQQTADQLTALKRQLEANTASVEKASQEAQQAVKKVSQQTQPVQTTSVVANNSPSDPLSGTLFPNALWHLGGYGTANFIATTGDRDRDNKRPTFFGANFNPIFLLTYKDFLLFESEVEFDMGEGDETKVEVEYAQIDLLATDWLTFVAGKFLSPVGFFQQYLHPAWINKLPSRPAGWGEDQLAPFNDVGVMARGGFGRVNHPLINYAIYTGNGGQLEFEDGDLEAFVHEAWSQDDNNNKAVGGRLGIVPIPHLEIGGSFMTSEVLGRKNVGPAEDVRGIVSDGNYTLWGVDAGYTMEPWNIRGEYMHAKLDSFWSQAEPDEDRTMRIPATEWEAWYAQAAYRLSKLSNPFLQNLEFVGRYGQFKVKGFENFVETGRPEDRTSIGLNYWFSSSAVLKNSVSWRDFTDEANIDATEYWAQFAYGF